MRTLVQLATLCGVAVMPAWALATTPSPIVDTTSGPIQGYSTAGINYFWGVPYAAPPVGALRWTPPTPPTPWSTTRQTVTPGNFCPQGLSEVTAGGGSEDCLYLNVLAPTAAAPGSNLPVMLWIHGGGLTTGDGSEYDGTSLIQSGNVVYVSFNYRLGLLGFMAHPALAAESSHDSSGNYGTLDQQFALAWTRANIANFGGNPNNITIFGESAGGQSVITHLISPLAGKFSKAIIESGAYARTYPTQAQAQANGVTVATSLGCPSTTDAACLRNLSVAALVAAGGSEVSGGANGAVIAPNVDNWVLTQQPFQAIAAGNFRRVPVIDGSNHDEYRLFVSINDLVNELDGHPGGYTPAEYVALVDGLAGNYANQVLAEYPLSAYLTPNYAVAAVGTDYGFSCGALLLDALLNQYVPVYAYEFGDINPPNPLLPADPYMPLDDSHAIELAYLYPTFHNVTLSVPPASFTVSQQFLTQGLRADWTSFARYGRPLNPRGALWSRYNVAAHAFTEFVAPSQQTNSGFFDYHNCSFWGPYLLSEAGLPPNTQY